MTTLEADRPAAAATTRWVYAFGGGRADGDASMKNLLGGKGANLAEMSALGLPVPPGFTLSTEVCTHYYANGRNYPAELQAQVAAALATVEQQTGKRFGDPANPLLVSVRSGARASMPGMMDTVLNLGLNDATVEGLAQLSGDRRFAFDSYRRFIQMYSNVVLDLQHHGFEEILDEHKDRLDVTVDTALTAADWEKVVADYKAEVRRQLGRDFPQDPQDQLWGAVSAVFDSWMNDRAKFYRRMHDIPESWGTAVNVQSMVFGNLGDTSATGVAFTRNPSTGESKLYGEFLINAQGEDVVAGIRTPQPITEAAREEMGETAPSLETAMPEVFAQFREVVGRLERHYRDLQDIEFTVEQGRLYMLQTRSGKRTAKAALKVAVDMAAEGLITEEEAIARVEPSSLDQLLHPTIDPNAERDVIAWLREQPLDLGTLDAKIATTLRAERLAQLGLLKRLAAQGKLQTALTWIHDFLQSGEPLVVFAHHVEIQEAVMERFPDALHLLGRDPIRAREESVRRFQEPGGPPLIVCATRVAAQGITLTRASNVCFLELEWTPAMHDQAEDRCHRIGQHDAVTAWYLLAAQTIDETIAALLERKRGIVGAVTDGRRDESGSLVEGVVRELRGDQWSHLRPVA